MADKKTSSDLPHWDLTNIYPSIDSPEFKTSRSEVEAEIEAMDKFLETKQIRRGGASVDSSGQLADIVEEYLTRMNVVLNTFETQMAYLYGFVTTDSYNTKAKKVLSELEMLSVDLERQSVMFEGWLGSVAGSPELLDEAIAENTVLSEHEFFLREVVDQSKYLMSDVEEALASELSLSGGNAWDKLQGTVTSQLTVTFEIKDEQKTIPVTELQNIRRYDPDPEIRRAAFETEITAWESVREPVAACLNGVKGHVVTLNRKRGREDALHSALDQSRIDRETLETLMAVMVESFPMFRRYFKSKAARLGKDSLAWWDIFAMTAESDRRFDFTETKAFILDQFGSFSDHLVGLSQRVFEEKWIDAEPRDGKRGGGFCMEVPAVEESRILVNYDGSLDQLMTIAHELGHAFHNDCQVGLSILQRETPMTLAETASTFCETIIADAALEQASTEEEELAILENFLIGSSQVIVDIYSRFLFEREVFERRESAELAADDFCEIMIRSQKEAYGDGLDPDHLHPYMWLWKPHYYSTGISFYNFPYAFGLLFGLGLYAEFKQRGKSFIPAYEDLLRNTGAANAVDLAARFDMDLRKPDFWRNSIQLIRERVDRYLEIPI
jgi:pepF/M3 family oligoendopeptidase